MNNWMHQSLQISFIIIITFIYLLSPFTLSFSQTVQSTQTIIEHKASAAANVGILENQELHASYDNGKLILEITGTPLLNLGLVSHQKFVYKIPDELLFIMDYPDFKNATEINYRIPLLLGLLPITGTIKGDALILDPSIGTVTGNKTSLLNLSLVSSLSATLIIDLDKLGISSLPPHPDGILTFYGIAAKDALINLEVLISEGASAQLETNFFPAAPIVHEVTDQDTIVTGTGEPGKIVTVYTEDGNSYLGNVNEQSHFTVEIPTQEAGTTISVTLTDDFGNESESTTVIVIGVTLELMVPETLPFKNTKIQFKEVTIPRQDHDWSIYVKDTRGEGSRWKVTAKSTTPLSTKEGKQLHPNALIYKNDSEIQFLHDGVLIFEGVTGSHPIQAIHWNKAEGILLKLNPSEAIPNEEYRTTIYWTLENAP